MAGLLERSVPVWADGREAEQNLTLHFREVVEMKKFRTAEVRLTASSLYRLRVNGHFVGHGPSLAVRDHYRVDCYDVNPYLKRGKNVISVEVAGYNCPCYYMLDQPSFLQAEVWADGKCIAQTGRDFQAYELRLRQQDAVRINFQRTFTEDYTLSEGFDRWATDANWQDADGKAVTLAQQPRKELLRRASSLPDYSVHQAVWQHGKVYKFDTNSSGFLGLRIKVDEATTVKASFDELMDVDGHVNPARLNSLAYVTWHLQPGEYQLESFEPYTMQYVELNTGNGHCEIKEVYMRDYANGDAMRATFESSDKALNQIFEAARQTLRQSAVGVFMDTPSRERAGWLCDSYFSARAAYDLGGDSGLEHDFLENFVLPDSFKYMPKGMLPMCYPSEHRSGNYIPNWAMWFVLQLEEYIQRSGDEELLTLARKRVYALIDHLSRYQNSDGLLERLDKWVFIEWSAANDYVQDVNYPSNMLYAGMLDAACRMFGDQQLGEQAERVREAIRRQSYDGEFFCDNAVRKDGRLIRTTNRTEVCQYYAFYFGVATRKKYPALWAKLRDEFGPDRKQSGRYPEVAPANAFIGNYLRLEVLSQAGLSRQVIDEVRSFFLPMAELTGTLWEDMQPTVSCCHGFASHVAHMLYREALGVVRIDQQRKLLTLRKPEAGISFCKGTLPTRDGDISIEWNAEGEPIVKMPEGYQIENTLLEGFVTPPEEARPRVWWHWIDGNISKDGIRKDLAWMKQSGIGGFQIFDIGFSTPAVVKEKLPYMSVKWKDAFTYAAQQADSLGLEMGLASAPGWSETGGPWVEARDGMKKLTWRETMIIGGKRYKGKLPEPFMTTGSFQNIPVPAETKVLSFVFKAPKEQFYEDVAVMACRMPDGYEPLKVSMATTSNGTIDADMLTDGDLEKTQTVTGNADACVTMDFGHEVTVRSVTISDVPATTYVVRPKVVEVSSDGKNYHKVAELTTGFDRQNTLGFEEQHGRWFRVRYPQQTEVEVAEIAFHSESRINHVEEKAGFRAATDLDEKPTPVAAAAISEVIDITSCVSADGTLDWQAPKGQWKIIRFGYSLTGKTNHPASPEGTGLEVDKLDKEAVSRYLRNYLSAYREVAGGCLGAKGISWLLNDSWEAGQSTWTARMEQEFLERRGYSLRHWLPVLAGMVVESAEESERFLWDWRKTIGEMIVDNHYCEQDHVLAEFGMKGRYTESHESGRAYLPDGMDVKRNATVPMSAQWVTDIPENEGPLPIQADIRESASVAHLFGQQWVAGESFTTMGLPNKAWSYHPASLKPSADNELANGLNRFFIHTSPHQPVDNKRPGLSLYVFGQWFDRHDTWAHLARPWTDYLARSSYMLQQGRQVADVAWFYGEDLNIAALYDNQKMNIPQGYDFDFVNRTALLNELHATQDGQIATHSGMQYRALVVDRRTKRMSIQVLRKINGLAQQGVVICGQAPQKKAGRAGSEEEFQRLIDDTWNSGRKNVVDCEQLTEVLGRVPADFICDNATVRFVHRQAGLTDIYWVNNTTHQAIQTTATFRTSGKKPQLWHPETGLTEDVSYTMAGGLTTIPMTLAPDDAVFVVFSEPTDDTSVELPIASEQTLPVTGSWRVSFPAGLGAPSDIRLDTLSSLSASGLSGVKFFSGTATYRNEISLTAQQIAGQRLLLDLGDVAYMAEVTINGQRIGSLWKTPYRIDITDALHKGKNLLEIAVTNTWRNRLIGDVQPEATEKIGYTSMPFYTADAPLQPSGLIGPVNIIIQRNK